MEDLRATRQLLSDQLEAAIASDPLAALSEIVELQREVDVRLREAVRGATTSSSWAEIAKELQVSKQAAHQRFKAYAKDAAEEIKAEHRTMKRARRSGDAEAAALAKQRRDELVSELKTSAKALKHAR